MEEFHYTDEEKIKRLSAWHESEKEEIAQLRARLEAAEAVIHQAMPFIDYFNCIIPEFDDDNYVAEMGFEAGIFRNLHKAYEAYKAAQ
jgi:hypothetical protein